ncbi:IclR family transcriptional regulator [Candidatus Aerophobetes bacterium]|uniref:IclR family transcriptional regulator n=1 Tax=Aerophobetes bacterium TaxID=2030807 RepID=A0A662DLB0_UNCAE|nr:MAG: IclR family transcriptional regulator [Candidatus Aerophobetes bacterium]
MVYFIMINNVHYYRTMRSLQKALEILESMAKLENQKIGVSELSRYLNLPKSTVYQILSTFRKFRFVEQDGENKKYRLGLRLLELGNVVQSQLDIRRIAFPYLKKLNRETNETAYLVVLAEKRIVYVDCVESTARLRVRPLFGERVPLHCTSLGKAIMAFLPEYEVERIIKEEGLTRFTSNTITDPGLLKKELELIRERGYAIDNMEHEEGIRCVGAPIRNSRGEVFAAISLSGPSQRLSFERIRKIAPLVIQAAREISAKMGYSG